MNNRMNQEPSNWVHEVTNYQILKIELSSKIPIPARDGTATRGLSCTATLASADEQILELLHHLMQTEGC